MIDAYADPPSPTFWKIHSWIDEQLRHWLDANGYTKASVDCKADPKCYTWTTQFAIPPLLEYLPKVRMMRPGRGGPVSPGCPAR
jgi:hypothetical protein